MTMLQSEEKYDGLMTAEEARGNMKVPIRCSTGRATLQTLGRLVRYATEHGMRTLDLNMLTGFVTGFCGNAENLSMKRSMMRWLDENANTLETEYGYTTEQYRDATTGQLIRLVLVW